MKAAVCSVNSCVHMFFTHAGKQTFKHRDPTSALKHDIEALIAELQDKSFV